MRSKCFFFQFTISSLLLSPSGCLHLLLHLLVPSIFPSITCFGMQFLYKIWTTLLPFPTGVLVLLCVRLVTFVRLDTGQIPRHLHGHNPLQGHQPCLFFPESKPVSGTVSTRKQTGRAVMKMQTNNGNKLVSVGMYRM